MALNSPRMPPISNPWASDELNQVSYCWVGIFNSVGVLTTQAGHGGEIAELPHLRHLRKLRIKDVPIASVAAVWTANAGVGMGLP